MEVHDFATRHNLSHAAVDELLQMLSNVGNMAILYTIVVLLVFMMKKSVQLIILNYLLPAGQI